MPDPLNSASLALSAVALIAIFEVCLKGIDFVSTAKATSEKCQQLLAQIDIEKRRLVIWGRRWGLHSENLESLEHDLNITDTRQIVHNALASIEHIVCNIEELQNKYGLDVADLLPSGEADTLPNAFGGSPIGHSTVAQADLVWHARVEARSKTLAVFQSASYSFSDEAKLLELLKDLSWFINRLWELLVNDKLSGIERCLASEVLSAATSEHRLHLLSRVPVSGASEIQRHAQSQLLAQNLERAATSSGSERLRFERKYAQGLVRVRPDVRQSLAPSIAEFIEERNVVGRGRERRPVPVYLEWKRGRWDSTIAVEMEKRIDNLTVLLGQVKSSFESESYRVLECVGYFEDSAPNTYGIFYRLPKHANKVQEPISLYDLLAQNNSHLARMPSLNRRVHLAKLLTISLHEIHSSGWLHKQISSRNVIFFRPESGPLTEETLLEPYFVGFGLSRPGNDPRGTEEKIPTGNPGVADADTYRHPTQLVSNSRREHDIYSLGLLLLEIARWNRLETLVEERGESMVGLHDRTLSIADEIDFDVGTTYCEVVKTLLSSLDGGTWTSPMSLFSDRPPVESEPTAEDSESQGRVLRNFYYSAVAKLVGAFRHLQKRMPEHCEKTLTTYTL